jgi:hypothetical protein
MVERGRADREPKRSRCLPSRTVQVRRDTTELRAGEPRPSCRDLRLYQRGRRKRVRLAFGPESIPRLIEARAQNGHVFRSEDTPLDFGAFHRTPGGQFRAIPYGQVT